MDPGCKFLQEYLPTEDAVDPVLELHLENCRVCPGEVARSDEAGWSVAADA